ncbi:MAG: PA2779 family protein [candidate division NC10 bacterium]
MTFQRICRVLALPMAVVMFLEIGLLPVARAAIVSTEQVISEDATTEDRQRVMNVLAREDVRREVEALGIDPEEATARVKALSDEEIGRIANKLDETAVGQNAVGVIVGALVLVFIILLITDLLCWTKVFPFTRCAAKN